MLNALSTIDPHLSVLLRTPESERTSLHNFVDRLPGRLLPGFRTGNLLKQVLDGFDRLRVLSDRLRARPVRKSARQSQSARTVMICVATILRLGALLEKDCSLLQ